MSGRSRLILTGLVILTWFFVFQVNAQENGIPVVPQKIVNIFSAWNQKVNNFFSFDKPPDGKRTDWGEWLRTAERKGEQLKNSTTTREVKQVGVKVAKENENLFREIGQKSGEFFGWLWEKTKIIGKSIFKELFGFLLDKLG